MAIEGKDHMKIYCDSKAECEIYGAGGLSGLEVAFFWPLSIDTSTCNPFPAACRISEVTLQPRFGTPANHFALALSQAPSKSMYVYFNCVRPLMLRYNLHNNGW